MTPKDIAVLGIGHAIVDILAEASEDFISEEHAQNGMQRGAMNLISAPRAAELYKKMGPAVETSGGSCSNTIATFATLDGKAGFIGVVADDQFGQVFQHDLRAQGVVCATHTIPAAADLATAQCLILVTPDAQRTMNTYLGASTRLSVEHIDENLIARAEIVYLEGYLFDMPHNKEAFRRAATLARQNGCKVAMTLSDTFCIDRHHTDFMHMVQGNVDILFANQHELLRLYETDDMATALRAIQRDCPLTAVTQGPQGSLIVTPNAVTPIAAIPPARLVDTTGAGDAYAGGFFYAYCAGLPLEMWGACGSAAASHVIAKMGPRPLSSLSKEMPHSAMARTVSG